MIKKKKLEEGMPVVIENYLPRADWVDRKTKKAWIQEVGTNHVVLATNEGMEIQVSRKDVSVGLFGKVSVVL